MPVSIPTETASAALLVRRFGVGYAALAIPDMQGNAALFPVALGTALPIDGYRANMEHVLRAELTEGQAVQIIGTGVYDPQTGLPVVEIYRAHSQTFGEYFIQQGWAVPDPALLAANSRVTATYNNISDARVHGRGVWSDLAYQPSTLVSEGVYSRTYVPLKYPADLVELGYLFLIVTLFWLGTKLWYYRKLARPIHEEEVRNGLLRKGIRGVRWLMGLHVFSHTDYRRMPSVDEIQSGKTPEKESS